MTKKLLLEENDKMKKALWRFAIDRRLGWSYCKICDATVNHSMSSSRRNEPPHKADCFLFGVTGN